MKKKSSKEPYNPLDKVNLGRSVANEILNQSYSRLPPSQFEGVGIYALYYFGGFEWYDISVKYNKSEPTGWPIYIGKAIPSGGRKGLFSLKSKSKNLFNRLKKHSNTIEAVNNLKLCDFKCKYLTIDSIWIPLGEQLLIDKYKPLWNSVIDGFGNNDPGSRRYSGAIPDWHLIHQGVSWVKRMDDFGQDFNSNNLKSKVIEHQKQILNKIK